MKKIMILSGLLGLLALPVHSTWAKCAPLIKEAREQLASAKLSKSDEAKVKALLNEAEKVSEAGNHIEGVKKANEALEILKKH
ncbi:MAG TPA: hypothetical protein VMT22_22375 [Terriglobales bacterium]|nr:hypothetical protein [Terriglobales bacterium]